MAVISERVDRLEETLAKFMEQTSLMLAATREDIAEIRASNARTDRQLLEMQRQAEKDRQQAEAARERDHERAEKHFQQAEKDRQQAEKERKEFNRQLAALSDRLGSLIEDMVAPNAPRIARRLFKDDEVLGSAIRVKRQHPADSGRTIEIDLLVVGRRHLLVCEAKSKVTTEKAAAFLEKARSITEFFPEFSSFTVLPMIASVAIEPTLVTHLSRLRIYALGFGDETMEILNEGVF